MTDEEVIAYLRKRDISPYQAAKAWVIQELNPPVFVVDKLNVMIDRFSTPSDIVYIKEKK